MRGGGRCLAYSQTHPFHSIEISGQDLESWEARRTMGRRAEKKQKGKETLYFLW